MAYRLRIDEDLPASAREVFEEQVKDAIEQLERLPSLDRGAEGNGSDGESPSAKALHDARKDLKKARSLLRLLRGALPRKAYRGAMAPLRDSARTISRLRDADALEGALAGLRELEGSGQVPAEAFDVGEAVLAAQVQGVRAGGERDLREAVRRLQEVLAAEQRWPLERLTQKRLLEGLQSAYRAGRSAAKVARRSGSVEDLHELRKRVKDRWYQERLVASLWPEMLEFETDEAHRLSDLLGDDHDLAILRGMISGRNGDGSEPSATGPLVDLIEARRRELQAGAHLLAGRLYAERPGAYRRRMRVLLDLAGAGAPSLSA